MRTDGIIPATSERWMATAMYSSRAAARTCCSVLSGQNIYPEEIEDKLNSLALVAESVVVQKGDKLVALVYPDFDEAQSLNLGRSELEEIMEQNRQELNTMAPAYSKVSEIRIHDEEFEKTPKKSIKRFLYTAE